MTPVARTLPVLRPPLPDVVVGASAYAARAFVPSLGLKVLARMVLAAVVLRSRATCGSFARICWATEDELAGAAGCTSRSVRTGLRTLEKASLLRRTAVQRGERLPDGSVAANHRTVIEVRELPVPEVRGLHGALARALDERVLLKTAEKAVLGVVLLHENEDAVCFPGAARIAAMAGLAVRTVEGHIARLGRANHLRIIRRPRRPGQKDRPRLLQANPLRGPTAPAPRKSPAQRPDDPSADQLHLTVSTPRSTAVEGVLAAHEAICRAPCGEGAVAIVQARLEEGLTVGDLVTALAGVMTVPWRCKRVERRTIGAVLATKAQAMDFVRRVDEVGAERMKTDRGPARITPEEAARRQRSADALARFHALPRPTFA